MIFIGEIRVIGDIGVIQFPKLLKDLNDVRRWTFLGVWWMDEGYRPSGG